MPTLAVNKRANYDYHILEKYTAGLVLLGHEVKSVKTGHLSLKGAYVTLKQTSRPLPELYLTNAHIPLYKKASAVKNYDPYRPRKLLLRKSEIKRLIGKKQEQGLTLVPLKVYTKRGLVKLEFGLGRGKKKYDKREAIKQRQTKRKLQRLIKAK